MFPPCQGSFPPRSAPQGMLCSSLSTCSPSSGHLLLSLHFPCQSHSLFQPELFTKEQGQDTAVGSAAPQLVRAAQGGSPGSAGI